MKISILLLLLVSTVCHAIPYKAAAALLLANQAIAGIPTPTAIITFPEQPELYRCLQESPYLQQEWFQQNNMALEASNVLAKRQFYETGLRMQAEGIVIAKHQELNSSIDTYQWVSAISCLHTAAHTCSVQLQ